ncbi:AraC family transcriptional regulator [Sorangium sp. So ce693]|uniref:AraC family transcriptional regulator n=1 Tax=Sorangium sp. So ce693 TaxID=3133318 RepID=UPI003F5E523B
MTHAKSKPGLARSSQTHRGAEPAPRARPPAAPPLPVARSRIRTSDPDEAAPYIARLYPGAALRPLQAHAFACDIGMVTVGPVSFVTADWVHGARLEGAALRDRYALGLGGAGSGDADVELGGQRLSIRPQKRAVLFIPERPGSVRLPPGWRGRSIAVERSALEVHFALLTGHAPRAAIAFEPELDLAVGGGATLHGIVRSLREEIESPAHTPVVRPLLYEVLLTALVTIPRHTSSHVFERAPPRIAPAIVRRAEDFIAAHAGEAITLADVVAAAGAPARSLQAAFRAARGVTPMGFLKIRRLEQARHMLLAALPDTTVAGVASAMGFRSAGRFSVEYRKRFHESPSQTLLSRVTMRSRGRVR